VEALVIDINALPETVFSFIGTERVNVSREADRVILTRAAPVGGLSSEATIDEIFGGLQFDFGDDYKFNRDEANDYE